MPRVTKREPTSTRTLLPSVLTRLARDSGTARALQPVWDQAVGVVIARCSRPLALHGKALTVGVTTPSWAEELRKREPELLARLAEHLGLGAVEHISLRVEHP